MHSNPTLGIVGSGQLGGAIGRALIRTGFVEPARLWIANRSGGRAGLEAYPAMRWTTDLAELAGQCHVILLALPPAVAARTALPAAGSLVISVMAGVTVARLMEMTGSTRIIRAMSNPAAEIFLAYSPWFASPEVTDMDRGYVRSLFDACGTTDEVPDEDQIDCFTAVTGPVPGFVAFFADCMTRYAVGRGVDPAVADRAIRQLFLASGTLLAQSDLTAAAHVMAMIDYAGTTAAGLLHMQSSDLAACVEEGLEAARLKTLAIARPES